MEYEELPDFAHELKRLQKKYLSLDDDFAALKPTLAKLSVGSASKHWNCLYQDDRVSVYKIRLACRYLRSTTMRVIYAQHADPKKIVFIELYYKGNKDNEDYARIKEYLAAFS